MPAAFPLRSGLILSVLAPFFLMPTVGRTWTNAQGTKIEAEIVSATASAVTIAMNGRNFEVPLNTLSAEDQQFVATWLTENPTGATPAAATAPANLEESEGTWNDPQPYGPKGLPFPPTARRTLPLEADLPTEFPPLEPVTVEIVEENRETNRYSYQSKHFHYTADQRMTGRVMDALAELFESTYLIVETMPWGIPILEPRSERIEVELYLNAESYQKAGGPPGSAGVAMGDKFLCLLSQVGVRDAGTRLILESLENSTVLTHEMTHVLRMNGDYPLPVWAIEGFAQMMETYPYNDRGLYEIDNCLERSVERHTTFTFPKPLDEFLIESRQDFYGGNIGHGGGVGDEAHLHYAATKMLMTYFWHEDQPDGDARPGEPIRAYLRAIYSGQTPAEARKELLAGRTWEELTDAFIDGMRRHVDLTIPPSAEVEE